jgi:hypothetical protein
LYYILDQEIALGSGKLDIGINYDRLKREKQPNSLRFQEILAKKVSQEGLLLHICASILEMPLWLALDEGNRHFPQVDLTPSDLTHADDECHSGIEFLETTRIKTRLGCCEGVLTLVKGSRFDCPPQARIGRVTVKGGEVILRDGQRFVDIREDVAVIQMEKAPSQMIPLTLHTRMPATAKGDDRFMVSVAQRDVKQQIVGGASAIFRVEG